MVLKDNFYLFRNTKEINKKRKEEGRERGKKKGKERRKLRQKEKEEEECIQSKKSSLLKVKSWCAFLVHSIV